MRLAVEQVSHTGKFNTMKMLTGNNELTQMQASLAAMMQDIQLAIDEVSRVSHAMSRGQLHERMQANYCGDLAELSQSVNESVGNVCHTLDDLEKAAIALEKGDLNHQISLDAYYGQYRSVVESIDQAIAGQKNAIEDVRRVTRAM
jgi:methyl-accepting chemotaxis protein